jgi:ketosteroid isomerase-like protein
MKRRDLAVLYMTLTFGIAGSARGAETADETSIREQVATYARAVDAADTQIAGSVWSNTADVSFIHPLGHAHGWDEVKRFFEDVMGGMFSERKLTVKDVAVHTYGDGAWAEFYWTFNAKMKENGRDIATAGRETQVYRKKDGRWSLVHVHYSGMPVTPGAAGQGF